MSKTSILMLMSVYQKVSGHTRVIDNLSIFLAKQGYDITIGAFKFEKEPPENIKRVKLTYSNILSNFKKFDILHNHQTKMNFFSLFTSKPFIFQYHGASMKLQKMNLFLSLLFCQKRITRLVSVSKSALEQLPKFARNIPTEVIYNGIDTDYYNVMSNQGDKKGKPQLFFAGNLFRYKNVQLIIKSMKKLSEKYPEAYLEIAGNGEYKIELEKLIKNSNLEKKVILLGRIDDEELRKRYTLADLYVSASTFETFGMPLLESMACGKPVAVSDIPAHKELVEGSNAGSCFSLNIEDVVKKITIVYENKDQLGKIGRKFAEKFNWKKIADDYGKLYDGLV